MELLVKFLLICAVSFIVCSKERLPRPLPDEDHEMLKKCLERNEMEMKSDYSNLQKRVYRLFKSGNYRLEKKKDPITGKEDMKIVRVTYFIFDSVFG